MKIIINNKEYKSVKMTRKYYKIYMEAFKQLENREIYEDGDLDLMVKTIVKIFNNQFAEDDVNEDLSVSDIIYNFMMLQADESIELNKKLEKTQKVFMQGK